MPERYGEGPHCRLWQLAAFDLTPCFGCDRCGSRCVDGWECTEEEFLALLTHLEATPDVRSVCRQPKLAEWGEGVVRRCWFRDDLQGRCAVYQARPLVCRLFGHVEWLPCPVGEVIPAAGSGVSAMQEYARHPRAPFAVWAGLPDCCARSRKAVGECVWHELVAQGRTRSPAR
ncbi:MAG: hypothetical protein COZ06_37050 [Armatimonadetes bacterium CG_4_10_14_3_um_filter_66_18]|nr:hypothetical protein [Armatimonadota bacterium]OIO93394.1 MAG: hypothetical protein AUJ96_30430 [Armatimonadetes bacterium CG2_30_66_41]PIU91784.1 MAG: hypothetical protein COS65_20875 [Armatimonadetes bacterium CG06_land_8_20_14_3_00_66_21]PIX45797.1 MAG: hypothetical protein COZ57_14335 [Armatimonadetes bacterium CG_4_8_14_3_um_filter_66_20]PIY36032.1 MAG: hypothetical protein COZ06_37050 [Armatimonadetes bacterium CG_4_10_14_3_um_filter_66_18]PIZ51482.1 MAG: hypothetical protein COY42_00